MIKLKSTLGNDIKCKIDPEMVVLRHELNVLQLHTIQGLLKIQYDKGTELTYCGDVRKNLAQKISKGLSEGEVIHILKDVARTILDLIKMGLDSKRVLLNSEWMFFSEDRKEVYLLYIPVDGAGISFDYALFALELIHNSSLGFDIRKRLNQLMNNIKKSGLNDSHLLQLNQLVVDDMVPPTDWVGSETKNESNEEGEALTEMDDDDYNPSFDVEDEAPTGYDEQDPPTEGEDFYFGTVFDKNDGTFLHETTSERAASLPIPYLYRRSTGEKVYIDKNEFKIGRSLTRANFCITNNNSVSNVHATIFINNGQDYYIKDNNSTNGTSVNGIKVTPGKPEKLYDDSVIVLFNEELEFHF